MVVEAIDIIACEILWPCPLFIDATPILALFFAAGWGGGGMCPWCPPSRFLRLCKQSPNFDVIISVTVSVSECQNVRMSETQEK